MQFLAYIRKEEIQKDSEKLLEHLDELNNSNRISKKKIFIAMIKLISTLTLIMFIAIGYGQNISESIVSQKETFNPLFSAESAVLSMEYLKNYTVSETDTSYYFIFDIKEKNVEVDNISLGSIIFNNTGFGGSSAKIYTFKKDGGQTVLNKGEFMEFYKCINEVYLFIAQEQIYGENENNIVATNSVKNILVGGEYRPKSFRNKVQYYFKIGDQATYEMNKDQFEKIVKFIREIKNNWKK